MAGIATLTARITALIKRRAYAQRCHCHSQHVVERRQWRMQAINKGDAAY